MGLSNITSSRVALIRFCFLLIVSLSFLNSILNFYVNEKSAGLHSYKSDETISSTACAINFNRSTLLSVISLLYSLQFQKKYRGNIFCVLIPTERGASEDLREKLAKCSPDHLLTTVSYQVLNFSGESYNIFSDAKRRRYYIMQRGLINIMLDFLNTRSELFRYAFITSAENSYSPYFLHKTISNMRGSDLVVTELISSDGKYVRADPLKYIEHMGNALFTMQYLKTINSLSNHLDLPRANVGVVREVLFQSHS